MSMIVSHFSSNDANTREFHLFALMSAVLSLMLFSWGQDTTELLMLPVPYTQIVIMQLPTSTVLPLLLITITFTLAGFCGGFAESLSQCALLDAIPNRIRNSMYSLSPTIAILLAMPQIAFFGWLIPNAGVSLTMTLYASVSLIDALMIAKGLSHPKPLANDVH